MALKVIGAGLPRTGTLSLKLALEQLGFGPCHHMSEIIFHPEQAMLWARKMEGEALEWDEVLAGYNSTTDAPGCFFYKQFMERYPEAKVVLSLRSAESWWNSAKETIMSAMSPAHAPATTPQARDLQHMLQVMGRTSGFESSFDGTDRERSIASFERHNAEVQRFVPAERLLVFEAKQGWEPLCRFLGVPVPDAPYPSTNSTEEFQQLAKVATSGAGG